MQHDRTQWSGLLLKLFIDTRRPLPFTFVGSPWSPDVVNAVPGLVHGPTFIGCLGSLQPRREVMQTAFPDLNGFGSPGNHVDALGEVHERWTLLQPYAQRLCHRILQNLGLSPLQRPGAAVNVSPADPTCRVAGV